MPPWNHLANNITGMKLQSMEIKTHPWAGDGGGGGGGGGIILYVLIICNHI